MSETYDALLFVSFGGPDGPDDVLPFLENVTRGRNIPRERLLQVAEHYYHFGGASPINGQLRALIAATIEELRGAGIELPVYWGNRNWHPMLADTLRQMADDGIRHALAFFTSPYSSYSSCRQYRENVEAARQVVGGSAPAVSKLRAYYNHPGFIEPVVEITGDALRKLPGEAAARAHLLFTAHSVPLGMAANCAYEEQLRESSRLVAERLARESWELVYQSRSGPPQQPWLEPDVCDVLRERARTAPEVPVVLVPIGFISDHMEVVYDLDTEARQAADECGLTMLRAPTVGTHPRFVRMIRELLVERMQNSADRPALGSRGPNHDVCPEDCCLYTPQRPVSRPAG